MIFLLLGCTGAPADTASDVLDLRLAPGDYPEAGAAQDVWIGPDVVVEPGEDILYCQVGTYSGPDAGIHAFTTYQNTYGHHLIVMGMTASELDHPDGEMFDCTSTEQLRMEGLEPLVLPTAGYVGGERQPVEIPMLDGMAVKLDEGQRYLIQAHYLNTSTEAFRAQDAILLDLLDPDTEVTTWAAPYVNNNGTFTLPAGQATTESFDCVAEGDWSALYLNAHMHEWGTSFTFERVKDEGNEGILDIPTWEPSFRDNPPTTVYEPGAFQISEGDVMRTTCNWFNDTDATIEFPHEMCSSVGLIYPQLTPVICDAE